MIPSKSHIRILLLTVYTALGLGVVTAVSLAVYIVYQFDGNAEFPADCIIVFGAAVHGTENAGPGITRRVLTATNLYNEGNAERLFFTGGKGDENKESEAHVMRKVALLQGVDPSDIVLEEQATSTIENILFTEPLLTGCEHIVGISDRYHLARISYLANAYGIPTLQIHPASTLPTRGFEVRAIVREVAAFVYTIAIRFQIGGF